MPLCVMALINRHLSIFLNCPGRQRFFGNIFSFILKHAVIVEKLLFNSPYKAFDNRPGHPSSTHAQTRILDIDQ